MHITNISDAKANLSRLIKIVQETDEPIIIAKAGQPVAVLSVYKKTHFHGNLAVVGKAP